MEQLREERFIVKREGDEPKCVNQYESKIKEHKAVKKIIKIAMAFYGKELDMQYQVVEI